MTSTLIFETHSTSLDNEAGLASGWYDVDLSPTGVRQAEDLARRYRGVKLAAVYASDLLRARRTAEIGFRASGVPVRLDERLRECDYGSLTRASVQEVESMRLTRVADPFPGGESYEQVARRVAAWLGSLPAPPDPIVVIGHRATFYSLEHLLNGRDLGEVIAAPWSWKPGWRYPLESQQR